MPAVRLILWHLAFLAVFPAVGASSDATKVNLEAIPLLTDVEQGKAVQQSVMLRLLSPDVEDAGQNHTSFDQDLIVVLDVSGSMRQGGKLEKAKAAISGIVNSLRPSDRLHLITYHSSARVEFTKGTSDKKEELLAQVAELTPQSSTNLYAGLQAAQTILRSEPDVLSSVRRIFGNTAESDSPSVKRIFLFSDGLVNAGVTNRQTILQKVESLRQQGTTTSAFGIGADYDEELMAAIAEAGHGEFFFIRGQEDMEKVVRVATAGFRSLFATDAQVRLMTLNNATGLHVYGQGHHQSDGTESIHVNLGDLRGGDARTILVDIMLPSLNETSEYLAYGLEYIPTGATEPVKQLGRAIVRVVAKDAQTSEPNNAVLLFRKLQQRLMREEEIEQEIESGHIHKAGDLEDELAEDLRNVAHAACAVGKVKTSEETFTCERATAAWDRTRQSQKLFQSGGMLGDMAYKTYKFKRQMNAELSEAHDEL